MNRSHVISFLSALLAIAFLAGCESVSEDESTIPWNRPADWEGAPGLIQQPGRDRY